MRYVILGAGAIGATIGGRLVEHGREALLLARGAHAEAMRRDGLRLAMPTGVLQLRVPVAASPDELDLRVDDVLVLATKGQQTRALLDAVAGLPVDGGGTAAESLPLLCAQNGVENERVAARVFERVHGVCVMMPADHLEPGRVVARGGPFTGALDVGCYPRGLDDLARRVTADWSASGFLSTPREDVMRWKHAKLLRNLANALDALCGNDLDETASQQLDELSSRARREALACFAAAGIEVTSNEEWHAYRFDAVKPQPVEGSERGGSSSWQSVVRGVGNVEADYLNGEVRLLGRLHGVPTPVNDLLQRRADALVAAGGRPGDVTPAQLLDALPG